MLRTPISAAWGLPALALALAGCRGAAGSESSAPPARLVVSARDTLTSPAGYAVAQPLWVTLDPAGRYVVADGSDKVLRLFDSGGAAAGQVGRPGSGPGEFTALLGGGALGDSLYGYDVLSAKLTVFDNAGRYARDVVVTRPGEATPMTLRALDDSLLLVSGFVVGAHTRDLLRIVRRDGSVRSSFYNRAGYFTPEDAGLIQSSVVVADGGGGVVFAGTMGSDSIFAFDYAGRRLGAGVVTDGEGRPLPRFRELIEANHDNRVLPDGSLVTEGHPALVAMVAVGDGQAVLQVMELSYDSSGRLDRTAGGTFAVATLDRESGRVTVSGHTVLEAGLQGRDRSGAGLLVRWLGEEYEQMEVARLRVETPASGGAE